MTPITMLEIKAGQTVRIHQRIKDVDAEGKEKMRVQMFEGLVIARRHGSTPGATATVRKISEGIGVEKIFPLHLPTIEKVELVKEYRTRRAKLQFVRKGAVHFKEKK